MIRGLPSLRLVAIGLAVAATLVVFGCTPSHPQSTFDVAGPVAEKQLTLFYMILLAAVVVFIPVVGVLVYAVIRFRRKPGQTEMPAQTHGNTPLEIAWTIAPAVVLVAITVPTIIFIFQIADRPKAEVLEVTFLADPGEANLRSVLDELGHAKATIHSQGENQFTIRNLSLDAREQAEFPKTLAEKLVPIESFDLPNSPLEVNVTGHQWWWEFEYPSLGVLTANELHVPVDRPVLLNLRSDDVIHSFWIPKLAGKVDMIPGNVNPMWFTARSRDLDSLPATFFGQCAEFCGVAHAHMRLRVIVDSVEGFDAWVANYLEIAARPPPTSVSAAKGANLFASRGCLLCHKVDGPASREVRQSLREAFERGELRFPAPNLTNLGTRTTLAAGMMELNRSNLKRWLRDPDEVKPGNRMGRLANVYVDPDAKLTEEEIRALASYLLSLK